VRGEQEIAQDNQGRNRQTDKEPEREKEKRQARVECVGCVSQQLHLNVHFQSKVFPRQFTTSH